MKKHMYPQTYKNNSINEVKQKHKEKQNKEEINKNKTVNKTKKQPKEKGSRLVSKHNETPTDEDGNKVNNLTDGFNIRDFIKEGEMTEEEVNRCEFWVSANRIVRETGEDNHKKAKIQVNTN